MKTTICVRSLWVFVLLVTCHMSLTASAGLQDPDEFAPLTNETATAVVERVEIRDTNIIERALHNISGIAEELTADYKWAQRDIGGIHLWRIISAFVFIIVGVTLKKIVYKAFHENIASLISRVSRGKVTFDRVFITAARRPLGFFLLATGVVAAARVLMYQSPQLMNIISNAYIIIFAALLIWFIFRLTDVVAQMLLRSAQRTKTLIDDQVIPILRKTMKILATMIVILWMFSTLGYDITALVAGLGIGGLAVALGLQDTLANLFGSLFIMLDHPFRVGDRIVVDNVDGVVEQLGLRSTRIRTLSKTLVCIPNKTIANSTIDNITLMPMRRVVQTVGLTYETKADQMEAVLEDMREIIANDEDIDQTFTAVSFTDFGASSLDILVIYFTKTSDFLKFSSVKERINLAFMRAIRARGLSIAFPTRSVYLEGVAAKALMAHIPTAPPATEIPTQESVPPAES